jgi:hypothetical protein
VAGLASAAVTCTPLFGSAPEIQFFTKFVTSSVRYPGALTGTFIAKAESAPGRVVNVTVFSAQDEMTSEKSSPPATNTLLLSSV